MDSCFVLIGTHQHGVANLNEASERANANSLPNNPYTISSTTLKQGTANENAANVGSSKGSDQRENDK